MRRMCFTVFFVTLLASFSGLENTFGQQTINYATMSGRVTDPTDAVISGAQVSARETETNLTSATSTDSDGRFRFPYLRPGPYEITVQATAFPVPRVGHFDCRRSV